MEGKTGFEHLKKQKDCKNSISYHQIIMDIFYICTTQKIVNQ